MCSWLCKDVVAALEGLGAITISFNPIPPTVLAKAIQSIAAKEELLLELYVAAGLAAAAGGDLRNVIQALQMRFGKAVSGAGAAAAGGGGGGGVGKGAGRTGKVRGPASEATRWVELHGRLPEPSVLSHDGICHAEV
jgi:hypothetical protein